MELKYIITFLIGCAILVLNTSSVINNIKHNNSFGFALSVMGAVCGILVMVKGYFEI